MRKSPPSRARGRLLRCDECNLKRVEQRAAGLGLRICKSCRERAVAKGQIDPAQEALPFETPDAERSS